MTALPDPLAGRAGMNPPAALVDGPSSVTQFFGLEAVPPVVPRRVEHESFVEGVAMGAGPVLVEGFDAREVVSAAAAEVHGAGACSC
jgi:hypothetical protein